MSKKPACILNFSVSTACVQYNASSIHPTKFLPCLYLKAGAGNTSLLNTETVHSPHYWCSGASAKLLMRTVCLNYNEDLLLGLSDRSSHGDYAVL